MVEPAQPLNDMKTLIIILLLGVLVCVVCVLPCFCMREAYECLLGPGSFGDPYGDGYNGAEMAAAGMAGAAAGYYMGDRGLPPGAMVGGPGMPPPGMGMGMGG